jgi:hypothetical protein
MKLINYEIMKVEGVEILMDRITCIAAILYQNATRQEVKDIAIQLLNGDVSLRNLKEDKTFRLDLKAAEELQKNKKVNKKLVLSFAEKFLAVEV